MITAYFSLLEHLFVFALAVSDFDPVQDSLKDFIGLRLLEKYKRLFDVTQDRTARTYYNRLHDAAEKWRNPYDHGGFDKRGGALSINVPGLGAIPLMLSDIRSHPTFHFLPERGASFDEVTVLFDEVDTGLRQSQVGPGIAWADAGLNVSFEPERLEDIERGCRRRDLRRPSDEGQRHRRSRNQHGMVSLRSCYVDGRRRSTTGTRSDNAIIS